MYIAFVLLTYAHNAPAGIERSIGALAQGLRELGHDTLVVTASSTLHSQPSVVGVDGDVLALKSVRLPYPAVESDLLASLASTDAVTTEIHSVLTERRVDVVCWCDASWGLGFLAPRPPGVRSVLMVRVLRTDDLFRQALDRGPDAVVANSEFLIGQAADVGWDTADWRALPNAVVTPLTPPGWPIREDLRTGGPLRIVARAEPHKGIRELIDAIPPGFDRPVDIVLAEAGFEYWPGMQHTVIAECHEATARVNANHAQPIRVLPGLPWSQVPPFLAEAAVTIIASTSPETFCNTAAEALSVGTPVVGYNLGHVPSLVGQAGVIVAADAGPRALWAAASRLLNDASSYHWAACLAPRRLADHTPQAAARAFLAATTVHPGASR